MQKFLKAMIITTIFGFSLIFSTTVSANSEKLFSDVDQSTKYSQAIEYLKNNGIVEGYSDGSFQPEKTLNRAELLKILIESSSSIPLEGDTGGVEDEEETANPLNPPYQGDLGNCFPDVKDEWFAPYVCYAKEKGIVKGYPDGSFQPANEVNFVEGLKMMLGVLEIEYTENEVWYQNIVEKATEKRLIPFDITNFNQKLQRGQMLDMMTRGIKDKNGNGELAWYLQNAGDCEVSYVSILENRDIEEECFMSITLHALGNKEWTELVGKNTTELNLSYRSLESVDGLENLRNLTKLDLGANELQDISFLADLTNLTELDLRDNWLWDISPVAGLTNLEKLNLNLNIMGNPAPLGNLTKLKWLGLYKNQYLYDISALDNLDNLEYVDLGLAELNEGELERFTENHPKTEIENVLKPWVGMKDFDLKQSSSTLNITIDFSDFYQRDKIHSYLVELSDFIKEDLKQQNYKVDDIEQILYEETLLSIKDDIEISYSEKYLWNPHLHPLYLSNLILEYEKVEKTEFRPYFWEDQDLREWQYEQDLIIISFNPSRIEDLDLNELLARYSQEILQDFKRKGLSLSETELEDDFQGFSLIKTKLFEKSKHAWLDFDELDADVASYWEDETILSYYLSRYPEVYYTILNRYESGE